MAKVDHTRVFLEDLPPDVRKDEISKEFSSFGRIAKIYLIYDPPGSGFVEYFEASDAAFAAEQMNGETFMGSRIKTQLTRGGIARGRPPFSGRGRGEFSSRGRRDFDSHFDREDRSYSRGGGRGFRPRPQGFESRGRGGDRFSSSRSGFGRGGRYDNSRGRGRGSRGFSNGRGSWGRGRGDYSMDGDRFSSKHYEGDREDHSDRFSDSYDKYSKYSRAEKPANDYTRYPSSKFRGRRGGYDDHSRSPLNRSPTRFESAQYERESSSYGRRRSPDQRHF